VQKKYNVKITLSAQSDIEIIWKYISQDNPSNAIDFIDTIEEKLRGLEFFPERNPVIPESQIIQTKNYRHIIYKKYRAIYRIDRGTVYILRIFHGS
jgi:plasmid stabilization system protein ParE